MCSVQYMNVVNLPTSQYGWIGEKTAETSRHLPYLTAL